MNKKLTFAQLHQRTLPFGWHDLFEWCCLRFPTRDYPLYAGESEASYRADALWAKLAPLLLADLSDEEVALLAGQLGAEHGTYTCDGMEFPDIVSRNFPPCLSERIKQLASTQKKGKA